MELLKKPTIHPFNIMKEKDFKLLLKHYMVKELSENEICGLRKTAYKFLMDKSK